MQILQIQGNRTSNNPIVARSRAYTYDTIGNRTKAANSLTLPTTLNYTANAINQYSATPQPTTPVHDADGNLTDDGANTYTWDAENRLSSVTRKSDNAVIATYTYDASSRLIRRQAGSDDTLHLYDGWNRIADYANGSAPSLRKTYLWGLDMSGSLQGAGGVGGLLSQSLVSGGQASAVFYPTYDGNGNISEYLDAAGAVSAHFEGCDQRGSILDKHEVFARRADSVTKWRCRQYDPFGNTVVNTDTNHQFAYRFSTKPQDATTGFSYYGYRWYDAVDGRWINRDPIEEKGGLNLYAMADNNAVDYWDYLGLDASVVCNRCKARAPGNNMMKCRKFESGRPVDEPFDMNRNGHENPGNPDSDNPVDRYPKNGPLPPGVYNLEPKPPSQYDGDPNEFPIGTPSVTTPGQAPGVITSNNGAPNRNNVRVHGEGGVPDSEGCPTCADPDSIKNLMNRNKGKTKFEIREVDCDCLAPDAPTTP